LKISKQTIAQTHKYPSAYSLIIHFSNPPTRQLYIQSVEQLYASKMALFSSQGKKIDKMETNVPDLRPLRMNTGNKNWFGKEHFF